MLLTSQTASVVSNFHVRQRGWQNSCTCARLGRHATRGKGRTESRAMSVCLDIHLSLAKIRDLSQSSHLTVECEISPRASFFFFMRCTNESTIVFLCFNQLAPTKSRSVINAMKSVKNPHAMCERLYDLVQNLTGQLKELIAQKIYDQRGEKSSGGISVLDYLHGGTSGAIRENITNLHICCMPQACVF